MSTYEYTGINSSATIDLLAASALTAPKGIALKLTSSGAALPSAGGDIVGIAIISNPDTVPAGDRVDVQIKDIGLWTAGGTFDAGDLLATDAAGKAVKATAGDIAVARALEGAGAAGDLVKVQLIFAGASGAVSSVKMADITDVDLSTPATNGQVLKYDSSAQKWKPAADATE